MAIYVVGILTDTSVNFSSHIGSSVNLLGSGGVGVCRIRETDTNTGSHTDVCVAVEANMNTNTGMDAT